MTLLVYTDCSVLPINRSATVSPLSQRWIGSGSILTDICYRLWLLFCNHTHYKQLHSYFVVPTINMLLYCTYIPLVMFFYGKKHCVMHLNRLNDFNKDSAKELTAKRG